MNNTKQPIDYVIPTEVLTDWQVSVEKYNPVFWEINRVKERVDVALTEAEYQEWQSMKGLRKDLWIRNKAIEIMSGKHYEEETDFRFNYE